MSPPTSLPGKLVGSVEGPTDLARTASTWRATAGDVVIVDTGPLVALLNDFRVIPEAESLRALMKKFATVPMSLADACLVRMTELEQRSSYSPSTAASGSTAETSARSFRADAPLNGRWLAVLAPTGYAPSRPRGRPTVRVKGFNPPCFAAVSPSFPGPSRGHGQSKGLFLSQEGRFMSDESQPRPDARRLPERPDLAWLRRRANRPG